MIAGRLALAERSVPRYTSYPTAPHFHPGVDAAIAQDWLAATAPDATLSLYLHVPFCAAMCAYCGCHTKVTRQRAPVDAYRESLLAEIDLVAGRLPARRVVHLHWGGGTPTMLGADGLAAVTERLAARFDLGSLREHAIEVDPRACGRPVAAALAGLGVTRASLGVQDFNAEVQHAIGRIQPFDVVAAACGNLRAAGVRALNLDLIYGLPLQGWAGLRRSLMLADRLAPDRIALFGYAHVPWMKKHQRLIDAAKLPGAAERLDQAEAARALLLSLGYVAVGLDHFARPDDPLARAALAGMLRRNFQGYTDDPADVLLGFGASAIGRLPQGFVQNRPDIGGYREAVGAGRLPTMRGYAMTPEDRLRADIIERLMCDFAVRPPPAILEEARPALAPLVEAGLAVVEAGRVGVTEAGRPLLRLVAAAFDAHLARAGRHSAAV
jgi:oxygen-independent coproporphyrinogen-3 oxidase